jgi:hypothetical protein
VTVHRGSGAAAGASFPPAAPDRFHESPPTHENEGS